jgi:hypothetical protein
MKREGKDLSPMKQYEMIKAYYGDRKAKRSGTPLIQHIDDGLVILDAIGAAYCARAAYCLHPIFQELTRIVLAAREKGAS